jgi:cell division protease FtsH
LNSTVKTLLLWVVLIITGVLLWQVVQRTQSGTEKDKDFSYILNEIEKGSVENVEITGSEVKGKFKDGTSFKTTMPNYPEFFKTLIAKGVTIQGQRAHAESLVDGPDLLGAVRTADWFLDLLHAADAEWWQ